MSTRCIHLAPARGFAPARGLVRALLSCRGVRGLGARLARPLARTTALSIAGTLALVLCACSSPPPRPSAQPIDADLALATFDSTWSIIHRTHFDPQFADVDWQAVREELRPRALEVNTLAGLRALLREMIGRTSLSHFALIDRATMDALDTGGGGGGDADVGLSVRMVGDEVLVWQVREDSPGSHAGIRPGFRLLAVGDRDVDEAIERARADGDPSQLEFLVWTMVAYLLQGTEGSEVRLTLADEAGRPRTFDLLRETAPGVLNQLGNLPPLRVHTRRAWREFEGLRVGVIHFNIWLIPVMAEFDAAIDEMRGADGLVIDLRGNVGGVAAMVIGMAGHLLDERVSLGVMKARTTSLEFRVNPRRTNASGERVVPFTGPVAILQDPMSMSTSEIFAQGLQTAGRARVFGETSAGAALPSQFTRLPNGDLLQHAIADFVDAEGVRLEGRGVIPDERVPLSREALLAGRDEPLLAALRWIRSQTPAP